jgi:hypothetical protein
MLNYNNYLGVVGADAGAASSSGGLSTGTQVAGALIDIAAQFGIGFLTSKSIKKKEEELLKEIAKLNAKQAEELKAKILSATTENAKIEVIIAFLNEQKIKKLQEETRRKRLLPLIGLGFGLLLLTVLVVGYKIKK